jgi:hypothetical protein
VTASSLTSLGTIANLTATAGTIATTPTASTDIANKLYVDTVAQGLDAKASCLAATTADITLSGTQTIDGVSVIAGDRVLVKNQTLSQNNGIYLCASGAWTRSTDAATFDSLVSAFTFVEQGSTNADAGFVCTADAGGTLGTTALPWSQFSGAGTFTAGTGLTLTGSVFSLTSPVAVANGGTGLTSLGTGVATFLGTPSSANLAAAVTDETGTGALVFATSPTFVTPALGAATATSINGVTVTGSSTPALSVTGTTAVSGTNTGDQTTITGNAGTATVLQTARNINGVSFNGSADITVAAAAGTLTGATLAAGVTASSLTSLGTIASLTATALTVNDNSTLGSSNSDTVTFNGRVASDLVPSTDNTYDLGVTGHEWRNLNIDGTANIDSLVADTADINGGTIDGTTIGAGTPSTGAFTTASASTSVTTPSLTNAGTLALSATGGNHITASTNGVERMRINSVGNVAIGGTVPAAKLDVSVGDATNVLLLSRTGASPASLALNFGTSRPNIITDKILTLSSGATDAEQKTLRLGLGHYTNSEEPLGVIFASSNLSAGFVGIGGGTSSFNAATQVAIYAAANNTTVTGTLVGSFTSTGLAVTGTLSSTGALSIGNTVAAGVAVASTHKVTIVIGGVTYYLLASDV